MDNSKLISVFVPYFNDKKYLSKTIESILEQTYENFELILFNHASTDGSRDIARSFYDKRIIHIDSDKNLGAGSGINLINSLSYMSGEYLKLFCADDKMKPNCLEEMVYYLDNHPDKDFVFSDTTIIDENDNEIREGGTWLNKKAGIGFSFEVDEKELLRFLFIRHSPLCFSASLIKMKALLEVELDKTAISLFDVHLWSSLLIIGKKVGFISKKLIGYRLHDEQLSSDFKMSLDIFDDKLNIHFCTGQFEVITIQNVFYKIRDLSFAKHICKKSPFASILDDVELIPFVIAHYLLNIFVYPEEFAGFHSVLFLNGYVKMYELMSNDKMRQKIEKTFGFGIKEFREAYKEQRVFLNAYTEIIFRHNLGREGRLETQLKAVIGSRTYRYGSKIAAFIRIFFPRGSRRVNILRNIISPLRAILRFKHKKGKI